MAAINLAPSVAAAFGSTSVIETVCYAQWSDDARAVFSAQGLKFVPAQRAIKDCEEWARSQNKDDRLCHITQCLPVDADAPF